MLTISVVSHTQCGYRKPLTPRVQGAACRQGWFPWPGLQRRNRGVNGFPSGATRKTSAVLRPLEIAPLSLRVRALQIPFSFRLYRHLV